MIIDYFKSFGIEVEKERCDKQAIYGLILIYNFLYDEMATFLKEFDLTPAQFNALVIIRNQGKDQGISQVDISKYLIVTPSNTTRLLDKLEEQKLIQKISQEGDRRVNLIRITERSAQLLDNIWPTYNKKLESLLANLNHEEQKKLANLMMKWLDQLSQK